MRIVLASLFLSILALSPVATSAELGAKRPTDEERGAELWQRHCNACHGPTNRGDGPATSALVAQVPDLRGKVKPGDAKLVQVIEKGRGAMPAYEAAFDPADARRVLKHMAALGGKAPVKAEPEPAEPASPEAPAEGDAPAEPAEEAPVAGDAG